VPAFKTVTHLPPYMGILLDLGLLWLAGDLLHCHKDEQDKQHFTLPHALSGIDMDSILFFVGICWRWPRWNTPMCWSGWRLGLMPRWAART
jgi:hypothetical protein